MQTTPTPAFVPGRPEHRRLCILADAGGLHAAAWSVADASEPAGARIPLPDRSLSALEEAVYSVPGLLADFRRVDIVWRTDAATVVPADLDEGAGHDAAAVAGIWTDDASACLCRSPMAAAGADVVWTLPADIANFLGRTFRNPRFHHPLAVLGRAFADRTARGNCAKVFAHFGGADSVDIACFDAAGRLLALTSRRTPADSDALYFILAFFQNFGMDPETDQVLLCGAMNRRQSLTPLLRRYVRKVLPLILGPGADAGSFPPLLSLTMQYS